MHNHTEAADAIVIGGGVIGLSIAWELALNGLSVRVLEQGLFGQEASWAGAGILPPGNPEFAKTPEAYLRSGSHVLWPEWTEKLRSLAGIDNGFHRCSGIEIGLPENESSLSREIDTWRQEGVVAEPLNQTELRRLLPAVNGNVTSGYRLPDLGQVRNPRHLKALHQACALAGVDLRPGCPVFDIEIDGNRVNSIRAADGQHFAKEYIVASGAWSAALLQRTGHNVRIEPVRGQIVLLESRPNLFHQVIQVGARYLVPRKDGRILIGSTEEHVGFEKQNTASAIAGLIEFGRQLIPALGSARFEKCWAGIRPEGPGGLPIIGRFQDVSNLSMAAGHFRAGLQLSPMTAVLLRQIILGQQSHQLAAELAP